MIGPCKASPKFAVSKTDNVKQVNDGAYKASPEFTVCQTDDIKQVHDWALQSQSKVYSMPDR